MAGAPAGERLRNSKERVLSEWEQRVRSEVPAAIHQDPVALRDMLPKFLEDLARQLNSMGGSPRAEQALAAAAKEHGEERANLERYTLSQVLREYVALREVIIDVLRGSGPLTLDEVMIILRCVQQGMVLAASHFAEERSAQERSFTLRLESEAQLRDRFVAMLSHDLRNPLSAVRSAAQLILRQPRNPEVCERMATRIVAGLDRIDHMIQDLLDVSRVRAGEKLPLSFEQADLCEIVNDAIAELSTVHGKRFVVKAVGDLRGTWSPKGLRRAIENLLTNAVKYGESGTPISIGLSGEGATVRVSVHNLGNPIPAESQARLFQAFHRAGTLAGQQMGWGLGLTLVRAMAEAHGGTISLTSTAEGGTTFTLELPRTAPEGS